MYKVEINFDEARKEWRKNKINVSKSMFKYCCGLPKKNGEPCKAPPKHWSRTQRPKNEPFIRTWGPCKHHQN